MAEPVSEGFARKTAVIVTEPELGTAFGAVYRPVESIVPTSTFPELVPFTCQLTVELGAFSTMALNCTWPPGKDFAEMGVTVRVAGGGGSEPTAPHDVQITGNRKQAITSKRGNSQHLSKHDLGDKPGGRRSPRCNSNELGIAPPHCMNSWRVALKLSQRNASVNAFCH
jgi:hypothetical protein